MFLPPKHEVLTIDAPGVQDWKARERNRGKREARIEQYINKTIKNIVFLLWKHDFYHIHCDQCNKQYIGETSRVLETRIKEHLSRDSSAVHEHCQLMGHSVGSRHRKQHVQTPHKGSN